MSEHLNDGCDDPKCPVLGCPNQIIDAETRLAPEAFGKLESFKVDANEAGYEVEARFREGKTSILAQLGADILSSPAAPNFFTAEVNHTELGRFQVSVEKLYGKNSMSQTIKEMKTRAETAEAENLENCRLLGMSGSRELDLQSQLHAAFREGQMQGSRLGKRYEAYVATNPKDLFTFSGWLNGCMERLEDLEKKLQSLPHE